MKKTIITAAIAGIALVQNPVYLTVEITTAICIALILLGVWMDRRKA